MQRTKLYIVLLALVWAGISSAYDYTQYKDFGVVIPGDTNSFTVTPKPEGSRVLTGNQIAGGDYPWYKIDGNPASWRCTVPDNPAGQHSSRFEGKYQPLGEGPGPSREYLWKMDTDEFMIKAEIAAGFDRVAPRQKKQVNVTTIPSPLPAGYSIALSCDPDPGTVGSATPSPATINETTEVTITGGAQSWGSGDNPAPKNIRLKAKVGNRVCGQGEGFTVCAHVTDIMAQYDHEYGLNGYGFVVKMAVASDSDNPDDLTKAYMREKVNNHASRIPDPPFIALSGWSDDDVFVPDQKGYPSPDGRNDSHTWENKQLRMNNLTYGSFTVDQTWQWECRRCTMGTWHDDMHYTIIRTVAGINGNWTITISQPGVYSKTYNIVP